MHNIQAIFFDYDNTLVDYVQADTLALSILANSLPAAVDRKAFLDRAVEHIMAFHTLWELGKINSLEMHQYRLSNTIRDFGLSWQPEHLETYLSCFHNNHFVFPGAEELLASLSKTVKLGLISNSYLIEEQKMRIESSGLGKYFADIVICAEIGFYKPAPQAFLHLVDKHGLLPSQCLFVGDSEIHDIQGAKGAGLMSARIVHGKNRAIKTEADYLCFGFPELAQLLTTLAGEKT